MASDTNFSVDLKELLDAGAHFGHQARRWNPKMEKYIYTEKDGVHIFDLVKTGELLEEALEFIRDWVAKGNEIVFVGTKRQAQKIVREEALSVGAPFVSSRWLGGAITNWKQMYGRIKKLNKMKAQREAGKYEKYTKKENVLINREINRLERFFGGISELKEAPQALFIVDTNREDVAVAEAAQRGVPIVGMVDSNADPEPIDYPIPINDDALRSIKLVVTKVAQAYAEGKAIAIKKGKAKKSAQKDAEKKEEPKQAEKKSEKKTDSKKSAKKSGKKTAKKKSASKKK